MFTVRLFKSMNGAFLMRDHDHVWEINAYAYSYLIATLNPTTFDRNFR